MQTQIAVNIIAIILQGSSQYRGYQEDDGGNCHQ